MSKTSTPIMVEVKTRPCPYCTLTGTVTVDAMGLSLWRDQGWPIQQALGEYSPDVREQIMSGFHSVCWDEAFSEDEDDLELADMHRHSR